MSCKEIKTEKYQSRNSPAFHAKDCKNLTKKGKDGNYISKPDAKGVYKWVKVKKNKGYLIHDNGARPYKVEVSDKTVEIYSGTDHTELVKSLVVNEVYIGQSPCNSNISGSDACGLFTKGNSILLYVNKNKYIYIGHEIYEFTLEDEFEAYYSVIGNSDVPYPVLLGSKYVYFMLDHVYIPRDLFKAKMNSAEWADAYAYYMGYKDYNTGELITCPKNLSIIERNKYYKKQREELQKIHEGKEKKMKGLKIIRKR
jgi:hypothetical protein